MASGCGPSDYTWVCNRPMLISLAGFDAVDPVDQALVARRIDFLNFDNSLCVRGSRKTLFRVRELLLKSGSQVTSWPADCIVPQNSWDSLGFEKGPWTRIAKVRHRETPTERVLDLLDVEKVPTYFYFGATSDLVFVRSPEVGRAVAVLRGAFPGLELLPP